MRRRTAMWLLAACSSDPPPPLPPPRQPGAHGLSSIHSVGDPTGGGAGGDETAVTTRRSAMYRAVRWRDGLRPPPPAPAAPPPAAVLPPPPPRPAAAAPANIPPHQHRPSLTERGREKWRRTTSGRCPHPRLSLLPRVGWGGEGGVRSVQLRAVF